MKIIFNIYETLTKSQKKYLFFLVFLMFIGIFFEIFGISLIIPLISLLVSENINNIYFISSLQISNYDKNTLLFFLTILILFIYFIKSFFLFFLLWKQSSFAKEIQTSTSNRLFNNYLNQKYDFHLSRNSSILIRNVNSTSSIEIVLHNVCSSFLEILVLIGITLLMLYINPLTAIITSISILLISLFYHNAAKNYIERWGEIKLFHDAKRLQFLQQGIGAIKEIKILNKEKKFIDLFIQHNNSYAEVNKKRVILLNSSRIFLEFIAIIGLCIIIFISLNENQSIEKLLITLGVFTAAAFRLMPTYNRLLNSFNEIRHSMPYVKIYLSEISNNIEIKSNKKRNNNLLLFNKNIDINNITFSYNKNNNKNIIKNFSLKINKGEYIGIIGRSGAGKSTLVDIILGLLYLDEGKIYVDGKSIHDSIVSWQKNIGYVPQDVYLTDDTIAANIAFGINKENIDHERLKKLIKITQLKDFINEQDLDINTIIGERGSRISGGQKQRIGIARALYNDPDILIFDEATSSLDIETENSILNFISTLKNTKTIISVSHKPVTLKDCDRIIEIPELSQN